MKKKKISKEYIYVKYVLKMKDNIWHIHVDITNIVTSA